MGDAALQLEYDYEAEIQRRKRDLIEKGLLVLDDGGLSLTVEGLRLVRREWEYRYKTRKELGLLMEVFILTEHGHLVL
ncbi:hypothetical protein D7M11_26285 [Paenibacillus ginsengarvi]|uniref:Uncharacterized protein n=1 Tax=Paenibacillus ginsengarvi TaxID=400777 RepID=A0A3B0BRN4_9BACL|nr:hypothetical protein D7M11_26285 [Paenibacillus ginsengarvi]